MKAKYVFYLFLSTVLGIVLSFIVHGAIEMFYLDRLQDSGREIVWHGGCALPAWLQIGLVLAGAVFGFFIGRRWWRKIYIEHKWKGVFARFK